MRKQKLGSSENSSGNGSKNAGVPAVVKAVRLLDLLAAAKEPLSLASLTDELELPKSTIHALCATLVQAGLVRRYESGSYHLGSHVLDLSQAFLARTDITSEFASLEESLHLLPEETIILSVLDGLDVVYVSCRSGNRPLGLNFRIGMRLPANCTASGLVQLSTLPEDRLAELVRTCGLRGLTKKSITDISQLTKHLGLARKRGYAVDDEGTREGMICVGAPVFHSQGPQAVAGIGVSLLKAETNTHQRNVAIQEIQRLAAELSKRLGARAVPLANQV